MRDALPSILCLLVVGLSSLCHSTVQGFRPLSVTTLHGPSSSTTVKLTHGRKLQSATVHNHHINTVNMMHHRAGRQPSSSALFQSGGDSTDNSDAPNKRRRKRVKRKEAAAPTKEEKEPSVPAIKRREDAAVNLQVQDVRDLVGGGSSSSTASSSSSSSSTMMAASSSSTSSSSGSTQSTAVSSTLNPDSLEMLLQDAKEMRALEEQEQKEGGSEVSSSEGGFSIPQSFKGILSTLVTVDFFVVCAFLVWFLAGIFCSYILKDDTVQIASNRKCLCCRLLAVVFFNIFCLSSVRETKMF